MELAQILKAGITRLALVCTLLMFQSCVDEEILDLPPVDTDDQLTASSGIISFLRGVQREQIGEFSQCFTPTFPLRLGYNNGLAITIETFEGLNEVATTQTTGQHINSVEFPMEVTKRGTSTLIEDNAALLELLDECEVPIFRDEFDLFHTQCFELEYPVQMIDRNGATVDISSEDAYFQFEAQQGFESQPVFVYPLEVFKFSEDRSIIVTNDFEFFEVFDGCEKCPSVFFETVFEGGTEYFFLATFPERSEIMYEWLIDNEVIETDGGPDGDHIFVEDFEPGTYEICLKASSEEDDCSAGVSYCEIITVEDPCPVLSFETEKINNNTYVFTANFPLKDEIEYVWAIFINEELLYLEEEGLDGDNILEFQFEQGSYHVCLEAETSECGREIKICEEIIVN